MLPVRGRGRGSNSVYSLLWTPVNYRQAFWADMINKQTNNAALRAKVTDNTYRFLLARPKVKYVWATTITITRKCFSKAVPLWISPWSWSAVRRTRHVGVLCEDQDFCFHFYFSHGPQLTVLWKGQTRHWLCIVTSRKRQISLFKMFKSVQSELLCFISWMWVHDCFLSTQKVEVRRIQGCPWLPKTIFQHLPFPNQSLLKKHIIIWL